MFRFIHLIYLNTSQTQVRAQYQIRGHSTVPTIFLGGTVPPLNLDRIFYMDRRRRRIRICLSLMFCMC